MSMHNKPLTDLEHSGLEAHSLPIGKPSQLSDCFRSGVAWTQQRIAELEEREAALAAHLSYIREIASFCRYEGIYSDKDVTEAVLKKDIQSSLARRDALKQAEEVQHLINDTLHWADGHVIANLHAELERLRQQVEGH